MKNPSRKTTQEERTNTAAYHTQQQKMALQRRTLIDYHRFKLLENRSGVQQWLNLDDGKIWKTSLNATGVCLCIFYRIDAGYLARRARKEQRDLTAGR